LPRLRVAGRPSAISAVQPTWFNADTLLFSCDVSGYHNPWVATIHQGAEDTKHTVDSCAVFADPATLDFADPSWWLGGSNIAVLDDTNALFAASRDGRTVLYVVSINGNRSEIHCPFVHITRMRRLGHRRVVFLGSRADKGPSLVLCSLADATNAFAPTYTSLGKQTASLLSDSLISLPVPMSLLVPVSQAQELIPLHLVYYPPKNPLYKGLPDEKPPAVVNVHGGPTSLERQNLNLEKQFFTTRGWLWCAFNYCPRTTLICF
jgi:dipeptidyl aminopeptidase/acylaminoacyl peptidase